MCKKEPQCRTKRLNLTLSDKKNKFGWNIFDLKCQKTGKTCTEKEKTLQAYSSLFLKENYMWYDSQNLFNEQSLKAT